MTLTTQDLNRAIQAKSDQLNSCDLLGGPLVAQILDVKSGNSEQPVIVVIDSWPQPWKPSKTSLRVLCACWGNDPSQWVGRWAVLYNDETVKWAGEAIGGIRTSHLSHIDGPKTIMVNQTRGKKGAQKVEPYYPPNAEQPAAEKAYYAEDDFAKNLGAWIELIDSGKKTPEQIIANIEKRARLTAGQKARIKPTPAVEPEEVAGHLQEDPPPSSDDPFAEE